MGFFESSQLGACLLRVEGSSSGNLVQGAVDLLVKRQPFLVGPALFGIQSFEGVADYVCGIGKSACI